MEEIFEKLKKLITDVFEDEIDLSHVSPESRLIEDLGMNSVGMLYMAIAIEEEFGVKFTNADFGSIHKVADIISKIEKEAK